MQNLLILDAAIASRLPTFFIRSHKNCAEAGQSRHLRQEAPQIERQSRLVSLRSAIYILMLRDYRGKVAVITGAGGGLGRALGMELAARRCNLALIDTDAAGLARTAAETSVCPVFVTHYCADVGSQTELERVAKEVGRAHGTTDLLINNAAISASSAFANTPADVFEQIMRINFFGAVHGCRAFLPALQAQPEAQILNIASCFAWIGYPRKTAYAASKGALRAFSESLRLELRDTGIGVTVLYPGPLPTSLVRTGFSDSKECGEREERFLFKRGLPLDRVARKCLDRLLFDPTRIVVGSDYWTFDLLTRMAPRLASCLIGMVSKRAGF
jgi:NAD(P)-dependent dehydrogenase (short-subunit alcohol dehydrogenase family)